MMIIAAIIVGIGTCAFSSLPTITCAMNLAFP